MTNLNKQYGIDRLDNLMMENYSELTWEEKLN